MAALLGLCLSGCLAGSPSGPHVVVVDVRDRLLSAARKQPGFPTGNGIKLTAFHYVGSVETSKGKIYVAKMRAVLTDMLAPRGQGEIMFFDEAFNFLGSLDGNMYPEPLWCADGHLYFFGRSNHIRHYNDGMNSDGNALDLRNGWERRVMVDVREYGSYFGDDR